ncbi:MAG: hypothetical protein OQJ87_01410 [Rhodospirillales bacterium]|nr:hypothetical protein [Rhodospirillales bacterium]
MIRNILKNVRVYHRWFRRWNRKNRDNPTVLFWNLSLWVLGVFLVAGVSLFFWLRSITPEASYGVLGVGLLAFLGIAFGHIASTLYKGLLSHSERNTKRIYLAHALAAEIDVIVPRLLAAAAAYEDFAIGGTSISRFNPLPPPIIFESEAGNLGLLLHKTAQLTISFYTEYEANRMLVNQTTYENGLGAEKLTAFAGSLRDLAEQGRKARSALSH